MRPTNLPPALPPAAHGTAPAVRGEWRRSVVPPGLAGSFEPPPPRPDAPSGAHALRRYWDILRRRWRLIAAVTGVVFVATAVGTMLQPRIYRATGVIELRGNTADVVPVEALFQADRIPTQYLETQYGVLRSAALARRVIADVGPALLRDLGAEDAAADAAARRLAPAAVGDGLTSAFAKRLLVNPVTGSNLVRVHYESTDPALAARVVNAVFDGYARMQADAGHTAVTRLAAQVDSTRGRLALVEQQLHAYARAHGLDFVENDRGAPESLPHDRLRTLQAQLTEAEADRYGKQSLHAQVQTRGDDILDSDLLRALNVRLASLRGEYAKLRSTFTDDYPRTRELKGQLDEQEALLVRERARIRGEIASHYLAAVRRESLLRAAVDSQRALVDRQGEKTTEYRILARDVDAQRQLYALLQQKLQGAHVSAAVASTSVSVVGAATVPTAPVRPVPSVNLQLALLVGLVLGLGLALLREYMDGTIRTVEELDALSFPLLGVIPSIPGPASAAAAQGTRRSIGGGGWAVISRVSKELRLRDGSPDDGGADAEPVRRIDQTHPGEPYAGWLEDAFSSLRTSVLFKHTQAGTMRTLLITSAQPGEGKTTTSVNLALSLAKLGRRVLLIDADTRRAAAHRAFGVDSERGLADYLDGRAEWGPLVRRGVAPGLDLLTAGRPTKATAELLASGRMATLVGEADAAYDFVLVDSPALLINAADTRILAPLVDGVIVVIRSGLTPRDVVGRLLSQVPNLAGVVLNHLDLRYFPAAYYSYGPRPGRRADASTDGLVEVGR